MFIPPSMGHKTTHSDAQKPCTVIKKHYIYFPLNLNANILVLHDITFQITTVNVSVYFNVW